MKLIPILSIALLFLLVTMDSPMAKAGGDEETVIMNIGNGNHGWLGVMLGKRVTRTMEDGEETIETSNGAIIEDVIEDSPADSAGLEDGDIIIKIDGEDVEVPDDVIDILGDKDPGDLVKLVVIRDEAEISIGVVLGKKKSSYAIAQKMFEMSEPLKHLGKSLAMLGLHKPVIGIKIKTLEKQLGEYFKAPNGKGVLVTEVLDIEGSPAKQAGLKAGDVLVNINGESIEDQHDISTALEGLEKDDSVKMEVIRNGSRKTLSAKITEDVSSDMNLRSFKWQGNAPNVFLGSGSKHKKMRIISPDHDLEDMDIDFDIDVDELEGDAKQVRIKIKKMCDELEICCEDLDERCKELIEECEESCKHQGAVKKYRIQLDKHKGQLDRHQKGMRQKIEKIIEKNVNKRDV